METRKIAIACQGGGIHGAFTCGVLSKILEVKEAEENGVVSKNAKRQFELCGISGTSAGALNAFMVWYGLMPKDGQRGSFSEAHRAVNRLWDTFQVNKSGEFMINALGLQAFKLQGLGVALRPPAPPLFYDAMMRLLNTWSSLENLLFLFPHLDLGEIRGEFYDFAKLLSTCAPKFPSIQAHLDEIGEKKLKPRLLLGAVEILSGEFEVFDSFTKNSKLQDLTHRTAAQAKRPISYEAVEASGTLPEVRRSQQIPGLKNIDGKDPLYWDGLFSQNPPVREFTAGTAKEDTPDEIWVIRINPQKRDKEPILLDQIEDRRNELAGNLSLNQELQFIQKVNQWAVKYPSDFGKDRKVIDIYTITMSEEKSIDLGVASKFDRTPAFVADMRAHGAERAALFLDRWCSKSMNLKEWPGNALERLETKAYPAVAA
jgi:NTE family protein